MTSLTGDGMTAVVQCSSGDVYVSTDGGVEWSKVGPALSRNESYKFAVKDSTIFAICANSGVYRSTDGGKTWPKANTGLPDIYAEAITIDQTSIFVATGNGVFFSTNNGDLWLPVERDTVWSYFVCLAASGPDLYVGRFRGNVEHYHFESGAWKYLGVLTEQYANSITILDSMIFIANKGVSRTTDGGLTWRDLSSGIADSNFVMMSYGSELFLQSWDGIYTSENFGDSWVPFSSEINNRGISGLSVTNLGLLAATYYGGMYRSTDRGTTWEIVSSGNLNLRVDDIARHGNHLFACTPAGVFRSGEPGTNWLPMNTGPTSFSALNLATIGSTLYALADGDGILQSSDNGEHWIPMTNNLARSGVDRIFAADTILFASDGFRLLRRPASSSDWTPAGVHTPQGDLNDFYVDDSKVYGIGNYGIYVCSIYDTNWTAIPSNFGGGQGGSIAVHGDTILAGGYGTGGIFRSTNRGLNWSFTDSITLGWTINRILWDHGILIATSSDGSGEIFRSRNNGLNWVPFRTGLPESRWLRPFIDSNRILVGTLSDGIWSLPMLDFLGVSEGPLASVPHQLVLSQNYPNPFNPSTVINYTLAHSSFVTLDVYNTLGQRVASLINRDMEPGVHEITWDANGMPSGVYFYRIVATGISDPRVRVSESRKMLLVR